MEAFPAFFPLDGRRVVIAGDGEAAEAKARLFEGSPAKLIRLTGAAAAEPGAYAGAVLAFVASTDPDFRAVAAAAAKAANVPVNVVDDPKLSDFHTPAIIDRGPVVAAVGTTGAAPLLASLLRTEIEARVPAGAGRVAALLGQQRAAVSEAFPDIADRRAFVRSMLEGPAAEAAMAGDMAEASRLLTAAIAAGLQPVGRVSLIEATEHPGLICLRAMRTLAEADVVVAGPAEEAFVAHHARRDAHRMTPSEADAAALADLARAGRLIAVVTKGANPLLAAALEAVGAPHEVFRPAPAP
ncbi:MAG TPA: bifunctional precorrin-2 dehydrogenase/sirohydrochlorin ferrochelatase [Caulobacteraceae bacterium]